MAGEWIPYDVCLPTKPEVLELVDATGLPVDQVVGRLTMLWGWASLNSSDGTARMSVRLLGRVCGGDEAFWREVERVGWLAIDEDEGTVAIPGWERRFSKSAKNRAMHTIRAGEAKAGAPTRTRGCAKAHPVVRESALEEIEEIRSSSSSSSGVAALGWEGLRTAWNAGPGRKWTPHKPPDGLADRLAEPGWVEEAHEAIRRLPSCRFFTTPLTLIQFVKPKTVGLINGGQYDEAKAAPPSRGRPDDRPPPQAFAGADAEAFERTKRAMAEKLRSSGS